MKRQIDAKFEPTAGQIEAMLTGDMTAFENERVTGARKAKKKKPFVIERRMTEAYADRFRSMGMKMDTETWDVVGRYETENGRAQAWATLVRRNDGYDYRKVQKQ